MLKIGNGFLIKKLIRIIVMYQILSAHAINDKIKPHWEPNIYKNNSIKLQQSTAMELIQKMELHPQDKIDILDIGCGEGKLTKYIAEKVPLGHVIGIDLSSEMIALAEKEFHSVNENLTFQVMDAEEISFDNSFDIICSFFCLQWVSDKSKIFNHISKHLKKGGKFYSIMTNRNPVLLQVRQQMFKNPKWFSYFKDYIDVTNVIDDDKYKKYATQAGLSVISFYEYSKDVFFDSYEELKTFIKMITPATKVLPDHLVESFIDELVLEYAKKIPEIKSTKNYITYRIKILIATR